MSSGKILTVAMTGASGAMLARELLLLLERDSRVERVHFIASESSLRVLAEELEVSGRNDLIAKFLGVPSAKIIQHAPGDIGAPIASGSYPCDGMIVLPCSMGTLGSHCQRAGRQSHRSRRGCLPEGTPAPHPLRPRNSIQQNSSPQHAAGSRCRCDHLPCHSRFLQPSSGHVGNGRSICLPRAGAHRPAARLCISVDWQIQITA